MMFMLWGISLKLVEVLEKLSNANGVTGREDDVRNLMKNYLKPYVDEIREDKLGTPSLLNAILAASVAPLIPVSS